MAGDIAAARLEIRSTLELRNWLALSDQQGQRTRAPAGWKRGGPNGSGQPGDQELSLLCTYIASLHRLAICQACHETDNRGSRLRWRKRTSRIVGLWIPSAVTNCNREGPALLHGHACQDVWMRPHQSELSTTEMHRNSPSHNASGDVNGGQNLGFVRHAYSFWVVVGDHMYSLASSQHLILGHMSCQFLFLLFLSILCKCRPISCTRTQKGPNSAQRRRLSFAWRVDNLSFIRSPTPSFGIV